MSTSLHSLLLDTVKDLHTLHSFQPNGNARQFEALLRKSVLNVTVLLNLKDKEPHQLTISTSSFHDLELLYYCNASTPASQADFTYANIFQFIRTNSISNGSASSLFSQLLQILAESHHTERRPMRVKQSYALVISRVTDLLEFFIQLHSESEKVLADHIARCFAYEFSYFSSLKSHLDILSPGETTEKMVKVMDSFIRSDVDEDDSIFSYAEDAASPPKAPLNFDTSDANFTKLYHIFLQLALFKSPNSFYKDAVPYVKVMLNFFKKYCNVESLELDTFESREQKLNHLYAFFLGSESLQGILSGDFHAVARRVLDESVVFPELESPTGHQHQAHVENTLISLGFLKEEIVELISNLNTVVAILNEYSLDFDPQFPSHFRHYVFLVYEELPDMATVEDYQYIDEIVETVATIVDFEVHEDDVEGDLIKDIVYNLQSMQSNLNGEGTQGSLLMRLALKETIFSTSLKKRVLRNWNYKTLAAAQLEVNLQEIFLPSTHQLVAKRYFSVWYNKSIRFRELQSQASAYSDKKVKAKLLSTAWIPRLIAIAQANLRVLSFQQKSAFSVWRQKSLQLQKLQDHLGSHYQIRCMGQAFSHFLTKHRGIVSMEDLALNFNQDITEIQEATLLKKSVQLWHQKLQNSYSNIDNSLSEKLATLSQLECNFLTKKHFDFWQKQNTLRSLLKAADNLRNQTLKSLFFRSWLKQFQLSDVQRSFMLRREATLQSAVLKYWSYRKRNEDKADSFLQKSLLSDSFKRWKLENARKSRQAQHNLKKQSVYFKKWKLAIRESTFTQDHGVEQSSLVFQRWLEKTKRTIVNDESAVLLGEFNAQKRAFALWTAKRFLMNEQVVVADLNLQRKYLNRITTLFFGVAKQNAQKADLFAGSELKLADRFVIKFALTQWKDKYLVRFENHSRKTVARFSEEVRDPGLLAVIFQHWRHRVREGRKKQLLLQRNLQYFLETTPIKRSLFVHWEERTKQQADYNERSAQFFNTMLHKKHLLTWYEKYVMKVNYLSDIANDAIDQKDYTKMVEFLRKWNLKYIKTVRRNQQTCEMFTEKWDKAKSKSIFELWLQKSREQPNDEDEYAEANTSMVSNQSPLAKKRFQPLAGNSFLEGKSYLHTPVKKQVSTAPFTPYSRTQGPSPTRLQETNQRMKSDQMEALSNRFRSARKPTGSRAQRKKDQLTNTILTRLSPPRNRNYTSAPSRPPAPRFEGLSKSSSPEASSSPSRPPSTYEKLPTPMPLAIEAESIETAKSLRRIRPIVIPPEDGLGELRYSPVNKLKERLDGVVRGHAPGRNALGAD